MNEQALVAEKDSNVTAMQKQAQPPQGIAPMVQMVASGQITIEQLDHLMGLQERHEAGEAKRRYNSDMALFRSEVPAALKDGQSHTGKYATFGSVMNAINTPLGKNGFNVDFKHDQDMQASTLTVKCTITHRDGHSESTKLTVKVEKLGSSSAVQSLGGNVSYLKRYCVSSLTGLATEDDDGQAPLAKPADNITESDLADIIAVCTELGSNPEACKQHFANKYHGNIMNMPKAAKVMTIAEIRKRAKLRVEKEQKAAAAVEGGAK